MDTEYYRNEFFQNKRPIKTKYRLLPKGLGSRASIGIIVKSLASPINLSKIENSNRAFKDGAYTL